ncbi:hypothetical protein FPSE_12396 [Fusarium pseudograminearum CS3096]|uniref:Uncharacterized protein n=1 Tax=Fusarium pseudograminearum (strain CS3096) TaxID=1028729 RepID=K3V3T2_FUSPC|nr:hypothetical protein FPSE_12396 [Fusarium pseudograminearum CS3096]EKJ67429.1 hypothetical protein FPSE_12396 [Fusarium pseudograminearum CS3096]
MAETPTKRQRVDCNSQGPRDTPSFEDSAPDGDVIFIVQGKTRVRRAMQFRGPFATSFLHKMAGMARPLHEVQYKPYIYVLTEIYTMHETSFNNAVDNFARKEYLHAKAISDICRILHEKKYRVVGHAHFEYAVDCITWKAYVKDLEVDKHEYGWPWCSDESEPRLKDFAHGVSSAYTDWRKAKGIKDSHFAPEKVAQRVQPKPEPTRRGLPTTNTGEGGHVSSPQSSWHQS